MIMKWKPIVTHGFCNYFTQFDEYILFDLQAYATTSLPLRSLDFSHNSIRRLPEKAFSGVEVSYFH